MSFEFVLESLKVHARFRAFWRLHSVLEIMEPFGV